MSNIMPNSLQERSQGGQTVLSTEIKNHHHRTTETHTDFCVLRSKMSLSYCYFSWMFVSFRGQFLIHLFSSAHFKSQFKLSM